MIKKPCKVIWDKKLNKKIQKLPQNIRSKFETWALWVEEIGLEKSGERPGLHDEPLKGQRFGQRSIRLNQGYRAIYVLYETSDSKIISVKEITKHGY